MTQGRYNFFTYIHKGVRHELGDLLSVAGATDFGDRAAAEAYVARLRTSLRLMNEHAVHEDEHAAPLLERFAPALARRVAATHHVLEAQEQAVLALAERAPGQPDVGHELYLALTRYAATQYGHMAEEESDVIRAFWDNLSDEAILSIEHAIVANIAPEDNAIYLAWMIPGMNPREREVFIGAMRQGAPPEAVAYAEGLARDAQRERLAA